MAKMVLPVDFQDDILNVSMNGKRKYNLIPNGDGTYSLEDVSTYDQVGSSYGAGQINALNQAVNESADAGKIIDDIETIGAVTEDGYIAGAKALQSVNDSLGGYSFYNNPIVIALISDGSLHTDDNGFYILADSDTGSTLLADSETYTTATAEGDFVKVIGADSVRPFKSGGVSKLFSHTMYSYVATASTTVVNSSTIPDDCEKCWIAIPSTLRFYGVTPTKIAWSGTGLKSAKLLAGSAVHSTLWEIECVPGGKLTSTITLSESKAYVGGSTVTAVYN